MKFQDEKSFVNDMRDTFITLYISFFVIVGCSAPIKNSSDRNEISNTTSNSPAFTKLIQYEKTTSALSREKAEYEIIRYEAVLELVQRAELELKTGNSLEAVKILTIAKTYASYHGQVRSLYDMALKSSIQSTLALSRSNAPCTILSERILFINKFSPDSLATLTPVVDKCHITFEATGASTTKDKKFDLSEIEKLVKLQAPPVQSEDRNSIDKELDEVLQKAKSFPLDKMLLIDMKYLAGIKFIPKKIEVEADPSDENNINIRVPYEIVFEKDFNEDFCSTYEDLLDNQDYKNTIECSFFQSTGLNLFKKQRKQHVDGANIVPIHVSKLFLKKVQYLPITNAFNKYISLNLQYEDGHSTVLSKALTFPFHTNFTNLLYKFSYVHKDTAFLSGENTGYIGQYPKVFESMSGEYPYFFFDKQSDDFKKKKNWKTDFSNDPVGAMKCLFSDDGPPYSLYMKLKRADLNHLTKVDMSFDLERMIKEITSSLETN